MVKIFMIILLLFQKAKVSVENNLVKRTINIKTLVLIFFVCGAAATTGPATSAVASKINALMIEIVKRQHKSCNNCAY